MKWSSMRGTAHSSIHPRCSFAGPAIDMQVGQQFSLQGLEIEVIRTTSDGRPARVRLHESGLSTSGVLWVKWSAAVQSFVPFGLPPVGATGELVR
jgi:hypothetical protein